jgi:uncharacterized protein (TIGR01777 family)
MKVLITGATGFIGRHAATALRRAGHQAIPVGRQDLARGVEHLASRMAGCDGVINLAGAPISKRWTDAYKREMVESRLDTTRKLVAAMARLEQRPAVLISTSAIGAFDAADCYTEADAPNATDFLGRLSADWEAAAREAEPLGVRTLIFRFGLVLGPDGGLMKQVLPPFRLGLGGPVADGSQHFSWVHVDDCVKAMIQGLQDSSWEGVYHLCAPNPVTNAEFTRTLGGVLHRPTLFRVPLTLLRLLFGEGGDVMASGQCVVSKRLPEAGFSFLYPELRPALEQIVSGDARR